MVVNGTTYHAQTPQAVIDVLERARWSEQRIRLHYGDTKTGSDWLEEYGVTGRIGRSTGSQKIPIMIANAQSMGGPGILDHCIVKITTTIQPKQVLYQHPKYQKPALRIAPKLAPTRYRRGTPPKIVRAYRVVVLCGREEQARFKSRAAAERYVAQWR